MLHKIKKKHNMSSDCANYKPEFVRIKEEVDGGNYDDIQTPEFYEAIKSTAYKGCPWSFTELKVGNCSKLCNETWKQWLPAFIEAVYNEVVQTSGKVYQFVSFFEHDNQYIELEISPRAMKLNAPTNTENHRIRSMNSSGFSTELVHRFIQMVNEHNIYPPWLVEDSDDHESKDFMFTDIYLIPPQNDKKEIKRLKKLGLPVMSVLGEIDFEDIYDKPCDYAVYIARVHIDESKLPFFQKWAYQQDMASDPAMQQQYVAQQFQQAAKNGTPLQIYDGDPSLINRSVQTEKEEENKIEKPDHMNQLLQASIQNPYIQLHKGETTSTIKKRKQNFTTINYEPPPPPQTVRHATEEQINDWKNKNGWSTKRKQPN